MSELREYLDAVLAGGEGQLHIAVGAGPHLNDAGKYSHDTWTQSHFAWPAEAEQAEREITRAALQSDVYVCPYLMWADKRARGAAVAHRLVHADIDGAIDPAKITDLGGFAVASGTAGHGHAYVALSESVPAHWHRALCRGLGQFLGHADAKIADNDVLRPPGTANYKPAAAGGEPVAVRWLTKPTGMLADPRALAAQLGVTLPEGAAPAAGAEPVGEPVDLGGHPGVRAALERVTSDRSTDTMRVVAACVDAGLTLPQTVHVVNTRPDLAGRLAGRGDDDVLTCWLKAVDTRQQRTRVQDVPGAALAGGGGTALPGGGDAPQAEPMTLADTHKVFRRWLGEDYDTDALNAVLATAAVESLDGDPLWLLLVSGSGNAKTETVQALDGIGAVVTSTITEAGLLSATPRKERAKDSTGGLLRKLEPRGTLVIKDVTSILSMNADARAQMLGALREVYDGRWSRNVGADGGLTLEWSGRVAVVGAVTTAWDKAHAVIASMGDRFVLVRMDSTTGRQRAGRRAIGNTGSETAMRAELAAAAAGVLAGMNPNPVTVTAAETDALLAAADLVTLARTGVEYDYRGDVIDAHAPEMPTRFAKQLAQVVRGGVAIGMERADALRLAIRCARDSMPPLRLAIIDEVAAHPDSSTAEVRKRIGKPRATVDRQLQALHMLGVLDCEETEISWSGRNGTRWTYRLAEGINPTALDPKSVPEISNNTPNPNKGGGEHDSAPVPPFDISGTDSADEPAEGGTACCDVCALPVNPVFGDRHADCQPANQTVPEPPHMFRTETMCRYCGGPLKAHQESRGYCGRSACYQASREVS